MTNAFVSIDLETTGLNPKLDKIIEIGAVKVVDGNVREGFSTYVNPHCRLSEQVSELTGITDEMLKTAPSLEEVLPRLLEFLGEYPLLGHRVLFDYSFVKKACVDRKITFEKSGIDTLKIARKYLADLEHRNLSYLCAYYEIPLKAHRAFEDAHATAILYQRLAEQFDNGTDTLFAPSALLCRIKKDTPATLAQKEQLYRLLALHRIEEEVEIEYMTRSQAGRLIDKLLSTYGR